MTKKLLIVANNCNWNSWQTKSNKLRDWFLPCVDFQIDIVKTNYDKIPFVKYGSEDPAQNKLNLQGIDPKYYDQVFSPMGANYDIMVVVLPVALWPYDTQARGWRADNKYQGKIGAIELQVCADENEKLLWFGKDDGDMFFQLARHEILHALYMITGQKDNVHYWWNQDPTLLINCLYEIDFEHKQKLGLMKTLLELAQKLLTMMTTPKYPKIDKLCLAIQEHEGWFKGSRSQRNNNPGNLRYIGQQKATGKDKDNFAIFATYEDGFDTLRQMIIRACSGQSKVYSPNMTITQFFETYAPASDNNLPIQYAKVVASKIGVEPRVPIKSLLT